MLWRQEPMFEYCKVETKYLWEWLTVCLFVMNAENNKQNILKVPSKNMLMVFSGKEDEVNQKVIREKCFLKLKVKLSCVSKVFLLI